MSKATQIGWYHLEEDTTFCNRGFECAAWYEDILVPAGTYPIYVYDYRETKRNGASHLDCYIGMAYVSMKGVCTGADFGARFCGVPVGGDNAEKYVGKESTYHMSLYTYSLAEHVAKHDERFELFPQFYVGGERYTDDFWNKTHILWGIYVKEV